MKKVNALKMEQRLVEMLSFFPAHMKKMVYNFYQNEIALIEKYGKDNPELEINFKEFRKVIREFTHYED